MRELTLNEMEEVYGGPLPVFVIAAGKVAGAGLIGGFTTAAGVWLWDQLVSECSD